MAIGVSIFGGYALQIWLDAYHEQQVGLHHGLLRAHRALVQWLVFRQRPRPAVWAAVALAFAGLLMLTGTDGLSMDSARAS
jgi:hypothetical protein